MSSKPNLSNKELDDRLKESEAVVNNIQNMANQMLRQLEELKRFNDNRNSNATNPAALLTPKKTDPAVSSQPASAPVQDKTKTNTR